jgi:hypothetical protein
MTLHSHVNNSGFPLQIALAHRIRIGDSDWDVLYEEHFWSTQDENGFIGLVLEDSNKSFVLNIECKRPRDAEWIFLIPSNVAEANVQRATLWWSDMSQDGSFSHFEWHEFAVSPKSYEAYFCVVAGQDHKARPMLERVASEIATSTYGLAINEAKALSIHYSGGTRLYINAIVTTAKLRLCKFDPGDIKLESGELGENSGSEEVGFLRFRKQLGAPGQQEVERCTDSRGVRRMITGSESTVFVINSEHLEAFLEELLVEHVRPLQWLR